MRTTSWEKLPLTGEGSPDIFGETPPETRDGLFTGFMSGVGQVIKAAREQRLVEELEEHGSLPMLHVLDEIQRVVAPRPRTLEQQALFEKIDRLQAVAHEADYLSSWLPREIEIAITDDGSLGYAIWD